MGAGQHAAGTRPGQRAGQGGWIYRGNRLPPDTAQPHCAKCSRCMCPMRRGGNPKPMLQHSTAGHECGAGPVATGPICAVASTAALRATEAAIRPAGGPPRAQPRCRSSADPWCCGRCNHLARGGCRVVRCALVRRRFRAAADQQQAASGLTAGMLQGAPPEEIQIVQ